MTRLRRQFSKLSPTTLIAWTLVVALVVIAIVGPAIWGSSANHDNLSQTLLGPSITHPFGTDALGRDILAQSLTATRLSLVLAALSTLIGVCLGVPFGIWAAATHGRGGRLLGGVIGASIAVPGLLLALFVSAIVGPGAEGAVIGIGLASAPAFARLSLTLGASVAGMDYVAAARLLGESRSRIMWRQIAPNIAEPLVLLVAMQFGFSILGLAALSFLGVGVQPPSYDWGQLLDQGLKSIYENPLSAVGPGIFILVAGLAFNLAGESAAQRTTEGRAGDLTTVPVHPDGQGEPIGAGAEPVLRVRDLVVAGPGGSLLVGGLSFAVGNGEAVGIVGESGSGKSITCRAVLSLLPGSLSASASELRVAGVDLASSMQERALRKKLGGRLGFVPQDPMSSLNPAVRVGTQLAEVGQVHLKLPRRPAWHAATRKLDELGVDHPDIRARQFPREYSGGMRQRAVIGISLMGNPVLIVADEPTTALDVRVQQRILAMLREVKQQYNCAVLLVSHDLSVVAELCTRVLVMYAGRIREDLPVDAIAYARHPYTRALFQAIPTMATDRSRPLATIQGSPPDLRSWTGSGCAYAGRCPRADGKCRQEDPPLVELKRLHRVACWHPEGDEEAEWAAS